MRNPNGFGSVTKLKGIRRKPYIARKTVGYDEQGNQIRKVIGYYATKKEALEALGQFAAMPYNLTKDRLTVDQIWLKAIERVDYSNNTISTYTYAYNKYFANIRNLPYSKLTLETAQKVVDGAIVGNQGNVRSIFILMEKFALDNDYIVKGFANRLVKHQSEAPKEERKPFTYDEIAKLWEHQSDDGAALLLIYLYSGWRKDELLQLKKSDIHLDADIPYMQGGSKTKAGKNRIVPIHSRIMPIIKRFLANDSDYLIGDYRNASVLRKPINGIMAKLGLKHCVHECRHTFRSELDRLDINPIIIDRILGHTSRGSVGERVYTHKLISELKEAVEAVSYNSVKSDSSLGIK